MNFIECCNIIGYNKHTYQYRRLVKNQQCVIIVMYCTVELRCHDHLLISFLPLIAFLLLVSFSSSFLLCSVVAPMIPSCLSTLSVMCFLQTLGLARSEQDISKGPPNQQTQQAQALPFPPKPFHELTPAWPLS